MDGARITLIGRSGCHLCDDARAVLEAVAAETGCGLAEVDFDTEPGLPPRYRDLLPVILVDGEVHDTWRVDPSRLRAALAAGAGDGRPRWWRRFTGGR